MHAAPARGEVVAELVHEDEHAEHDDEGDQRARQRRQSGPEIPSSSNAITPCRPRRILWSSGGARGERRACGRPRAAPRASQRQHRIAGPVDRRRCRARASVSSTTAAISRKPSRRSRKSADRHLVRGIQYGGGAPPPAAQRLARQAQRREAHRVGRRRSRAGPAPRGRAAAAATAMPVRPGQGMGDRRAHVRRAELRQHRAVGILHQAVHGGLRVDQRPRSGPPAPGTAGRPRSAPGPCSSWWRCRPRSWRPSSRSGGATACSGVTAAIVARSGMCGTARPRRSARSSRSPPASRRVERLEDGVVLGIDRQQRGAGRARRGRSTSSPGADQAFLVGQRQRRRRGRARPGWSAARRRRRWRPWSSRPGRAAASTTASGPAAASIAGAGQRLPQRGVARRVGDHGEPGARGAAPGRPGAATSRPATSASTAKRAGRRRHPAAPGC